MHDPIENLFQGSSAQGLVHTLRQQISRIEGARRSEHDRPVSSGCPALDRLLPARGFRRGTLVEWLTAGEGTGASTLAVLSAREACTHGRACLVLDRQGQFHAPAAIRMGIALEQLIVVHARDRADHDWAMDQALRCRAVAALLAWPDAVDGHTFRRWQLAAEEGGSLGLLVRGDTAREEPSWADVRLGVEPLPEEKSGTGRRVRIHLLRCRGADSGKSVEVEIDDETHTVHLVSRVAPSATHPGAAATS